MVALIGFPAGLAIAGALGVVGRDVIAYVAMAGLAEALALLKAWSSAKRGDLEIAARSTTTGVFAVVEDSTALAKRDRP